VFHLGVAYGTDMDKVAEVVNKVGDEMYADEDWNAKILEPPRYVGITAFNDSDITFRAMFKTHTFENWAAEREFNQRIKVAFEAANITIPFPQREVTVIKELG
jgi:small conductance mechanosensitive channel